MHTDSIIINDLEIYANHGVLSEETALGQKFLISATMYTDTTKAGLSDSIEDSVNYADVCQFITKYLTENTFKLLEAAAENLATQILLAYPLISKIDVEIKKPWAPIGLPLNCVSVKITRGWHIAYIALGSNMGDKEKYLNDAITMINDDDMCIVNKVSSFIITPPYGYTEQDDFLNGAIKIQTLYSPKMLLSFLQEIEKKANRVRQIHWGPRTLDLDILLYDNLICDDDTLTIPHPELHKRDFVLIPLREISPNCVHPLLNKRINELITEIS
ncbi:MAG: 2-amino-4-hydroxy-6-hydroxymethyldihydropteridine diphosphokinase [Lachnospiraceae bacterium]|nr:2-amino-4-hydroxy-6-hydroxymethyldihydropteridine diphosphokinase [Lachnospiraceae bacterium]